MTVAAESRSPVVGTVGVSTGTVAVSTGTVGTGTVAAALGTVAVAFEAHPSGSRASGRWRPVDGGR
ncbi:hypothetical protein J3A78_001599 [Streptomyces sp. PvR006]|nr:hypothetical protein [Streptomyces sp. PvR006]